MEFHQFQSDQPLDLDTPAVCQTLPGLTDQQKGVCTKVPETVESVPFGTRQGLVECEYQFREHFKIITIFYVQYSNFSTLICSSQQDSMINISSLAVAKSNCWSQKVNKCDDIEIGCCRNELWNCSDNRDSRRIQHTIDRGEYYLNIN